MQTARDRSGVVTLLTDFGRSDVYVGVMHGVIHRYSDRVRHVVDLTHEVPPQDVALAAFHLHHAWRWFPEGTVHVAVVDPGVGSDRAILAVEKAGHLFLAPDNGLLGRIADDATSIAHVDHDRIGLPDRSATFHGRDVFSPAAARLVDGASPTDLGPAGQPVVGAAAPAPEALRDGGFGGVVLSIDHFGNVITNLPVGLLMGPREAWTLECAGQRFTISQTYASVDPGQTLALVDSYGLLEVAVREGDAARDAEGPRGVPLADGDLEQAVGIYQRQGLSRVDARVRLRNREALA
ncbi:MAG: SAM-dependent chlorinase/fluorinase, partial [Planctomycetota bacterium]